LITELASGDAPWAAALMERRRREYERYSPVFWRPAVGAAGLHARFLRRQIESDQTIALRTDHGFAICQRRQAEGFVDDFTVDPPGRWDADGAELLLALAQRLAAGGVHVLRVVTAQADAPKTALLRRCSLVVAEQWWVRELTPAVAPSAFCRVDGPSFSGLLIPAPPVYDPGGPVYLADRASPEATGDGIARTAASHGAVLAIIPAAPDSARAGQRLHDRERWAGRRRRSNPY
jgi:hypothetical protein